MSSVLRAYYELTKPGIVYGNILTATAGFLLASQTNINFWLLAQTLAGIALVIASACVYNNYIDRGIDKKMARTKKRALVDGTISGRAALLYATVLGILGFAVLILFTNTLTVVLGIVAITTYVALYGISKRRSVHGTLVGSIAGSLPPVAGYTAVSNTVDTAAVLLFLVITFWQMPHFYAIAMRRLADYTAAGIPVLPSQRSSTYTKITILLYVIAFTAAACALTLYGYTSWTHAAICLLAGTYWFYVGIKGFHGHDDINWARRMFLVSLSIILVFSITTMLSSVLP